MPTVLCQALWPLGNTLDQNSDQSSSEQAYSHCKAFSWTEQLYCKVLSEAWPQGQHANALHTGNIVPRDCFIMHIPFTIELLPHRADTSLGGEQLHQLLIVPHLRINEIFLTCQQTLDSAHQWPS